MSLCAPVADSTISDVGIFSVAIGLHIFKSGGDKIRILNSGGDMSPPLSTPMHSGLPRV